MFQDIILSMYCMYSQNSNYRNSQIKKMAISIKTSSYCELLSLSVCRSDDFIHSKETIKT